LLIDHWQSFGFLLSADKNLRTKTAAKKWLKTLKGVIYMNDNEKMLKI